MWIELHVWFSGLPIMIAVEAIAQVTIVTTLDEPNHAVVHRVDGGSVEVKETYEQVKDALGKVKP